MFDIKELRKDIKINKNQRLEFINLWCDYMRKISNKEWSRQQAELINSQITKKMIK